MDRGDIKIPVVGAGRALPTTSDGDLVIITGVEAVEQWARMTMMVSAGSEVTRPEWGAGLAAMLGRPEGSAAASAFKSRLRAQLVSDPRIADAQVTVSTSYQQPGRITVGYVLDLVDGTTIRSAVAVQE